MADDSQRYCRLLYVPEGSATDPTANSYSRQMVQACRKLGLNLASARIGSTADLLRGLRERRRTVALVNWLENHIVDDAGRFSSRGSLTYLRKLVKLRLLAGAVLYVQHNRYPHHTRSTAQAMVQRTMRWATRWLVDCVILHDHDPVGRHRTYLPHPSYPVHPGLTTAPERRIVCFGRIAPYKALEDLVDRWSGDWTLLIAGAVRDHDYLRALQARAAGKNILFRTETLSDEAAAELIASCAAAIVAHSSPSMIVSGSLYFALSCGVPVVAAGLEHARHLVERGQPGVHFIGSLQQLPHVDWHAVSQVDRSTVRARAHLDFGTDAIAMKLQAILSRT